MFSFQQDESFLAKKLRRENDVYELRRDEEQYNMEKIETNKNLLKPFINASEIEEEELKPFLDIFSIKSQEYILDIDEDINSEDLCFINPKNTKTNFTQELPEFILFTPPIEKLEYEAKHDFSKRRLKNPCRHFERKSNIYTKINNRFFNTHLNIALNKKLIKEGYNENFAKFSQKFVEVNQEKNIKIMNSTLIQVFKDDNLYEIKDREIYEYNLKIVKKIEKEGNAELNSILNMKVKTLFEEYLNSKEFIDEINRQKKPNEKCPKGDYYIEKFIYLAKNLPEYGVQLH
jgi:hypothetical protein